MINYSRHQPITFSFLIKRKHSPRMKCIVLVSSESRDTSDRSLIANQGGLSVITFYQKFSLAFDLSLIIYISNDKYYTFVISLTNNRDRESPRKGLMLAKELVDSFMAKEEDTPSSPLME